MLLLISIISFSFIKERLIRNEKDTGVIAEEDNDKNIKDIDIDSKEN